MTLGASDHGQHGFSLAEMLVVLANLSLCTALAAPSLVDVAGTRSMNRSALEIAALLRAARAQAVFSGKDALVSVDSAAKEVSAGWTSRKAAIPASAGIRVLTAREEVVTASIAPFRFFADGSATGGEIELTTARSRVVLTVDWLTGRVDRREQR